MSTILYLSDKALLALSESIKKKYLDSLEFAEKYRILFGKILIIYYEKNDQIRTADVQSSRSNRDSPSHL